MNNMIKISISHNSRKTNFDPHNILICYYPCYKFMLHALLQMILSLLYNVYYVLVETVISRNSGLRYM